MMGKKEEYENKVNLYLDRDQLTGEVDLASSPLPPKNIKLEEDETYVYPVFRALSKIIVPGHYLNLEKKNVLKSSARLLKNQTVYPNHTTDVNQWLGSVLSVKWDDTSEPNGINVKLQIPKSQNERIVEGIRLGALHSVSVGFNFLWEKSHARDDFWRVLGEEVDGEMVSLIVTCITGYREISLVYQGADPYATRRASLFPINQIKDVTPTTEERQADGMLSPDSPQQNENNGGKEKTMKLTKKIAKELGLELPEFLDENVEEVDLKQSTLNGILAQFKINVKRKEREAEKLSVRISALSNPLSTLIGEDASELSAEEIEAHLQDIKVSTEMGNDYIASLRQETKNLYQLCKGDRSDQAILTILETCELRTLKALYKDYKDEASKLHLPKETRQSSILNSESDTSDELNIEDYKN